jgi:peptidoglycan/LPS O-acetylase OafA/YrhL
LKHDNNFDLLRLLAASEVAAVHSFDFLHLPFPGRDYALLFPGVAVFFVISGFLITGSYVGSGRQTGKYALNRFLRIYPGMWLNLLFILVLMLWTGNLVITAHNWWNVAGYFGILATTASTYFADTLIGIGSFAEYGPPPVLGTFPGGVLWTLTVELGFYLLVPLIFFSRWRWWHLAAYFVISFATALALPTLNSVAILTSIIPYLWIFLIGAACKLAWDRVQFLFRNTFPLWLIVHVAFGVVPDFNIAPTFRSLLAIFTLAGCTLSFAYTLPSLARILRGQDVSYGMYLYHMPVVLTLAMLGYRDNSAIWLVVYGITGALATLSWILVERPCLQLKRVRQSGGSPMQAEAAIGEYIPINGIRNDSRS